MGLDADIAELLAQFSPDVAKTASGVIAAVRRVRPDMTAKVQFGWRAVNFRHVRAGYVCGVFPTRTKVLLGFQNGRELDSPYLTDDGKVKRFRWIEYPRKRPVSDDDLAILIAEAIALRS